MAPTSPRDLYPRTREATSAGCDCSYRDGEDQDNLVFPDWLTQDCPLHRPLCFRQDPPPDRDGGPDPLAKPARSP